MTPKSGQLLVDLIQRNAMDHGADQFLNFGERWFNHAEGHNRSSRLAAGLANIGVKPGDRVASILPNCIESVDLLFACAKLGAIHVPVNIFLKGEFLRYQLVDCDPAVVIGDRSGIELATDIDLSCRVCGPFCLLQELTKLQLPQVSRPRGRPIS